MTWFVARGAVSLKVYLKQVRLWAVISWLTWAPVQTDWGHSLPPCSCGVFWSPASQGHTPCLYPTRACCLEETDENTLITTWGKTSREERKCCPLLLLLQILPQGSCAVSRSRFCWEVNHKWPVGSSSSFVSLCSWRLAWASWELALQTCTTTVPLHHTFSLLIHLPSKKLFGELERFLQVLSIQMCANLCVGHAVGCYKEVFRDMNDFVCAQITSYRWFSFLTTDLGLLWM